MKLVSMSIRLTAEQLASLQAIADRIGHGATVTGVIRQAALDAIARETARGNGAGQ